MPSTAPEELLTPPDYRDYLHVAAAVIDSGSGEVLIAKRHDHLHQGGLWEFPGGKVEADEECYSALCRELNEELGITVDAAHPLLRIPYHYPERKVLLDVWRVTRFHGVPHGAEGQPLAWVRQEALGEYAFPAANRPIVTAAQLPSCYLITPEPGSEAEWPHFLLQLRRSLEAGVTLLQLRATTLGRSDYLHLARAVAPLCREYGARLLLNADASLLDEVDAAGLHLNAQRLMALARRPLGEGRLLAASCHNLQELQQAERIGADFALLSPVNSTASHPGARGMGWQQFRAMSERCSLPLYALGGMALGDLPQAWAHGAQGIAAIRSLWGEGSQCEG